MKNRSMKRSPYPKQDRLVSERTYREDRIFYFFSLVKISKNMYQTIIAPITM